MSLSVLVIGSPGRLRDSLCAILHSFPNISEILTADNVDFGSNLAAKKDPQVLIFDEKVSIENDRCFFDDLARHPRHCPILVIAKSRQQARMALQGGADAVLFSGFSTHSLFQTLQAFDTGAEDDFSDRPTTLNRKEAAVAQLAPRR